MLLPDVDRGSRDLEGLEQGGRSDDDGVAAAVSDSEHHAGVCHDARLGERLEVQEPAEPGDCRGVQL